ncbi:MAG: SUMF1/EgtB/PvdO family nonheme iron enzyme [Muribaculaceae bacterium]|nr:SUMF1/EgtB/PvdO family nonheme iron enzyme [Muribaculaceae bacterium]
MVFRLYDDEQPKTKEELLKKLISDMVLVEGGIFIMGATPEQEDDAWELEFPAHQVKLSSFYMCRVEVSQALWDAVMGSNPSSCQGWNRPVETVSWDDCNKFINRLNEITGITFRLPTEAEWEYAARGGNRSGHYMYAGSNELDKVAWYNENSEATTHPVGGKQPNELGLYDMSGNVWEWCVDWQNFYSDDIQINPVGDYQSQGRVMRGGCWKQSDTLCRVSFRGVSAPEMRTSECGLRLVATKLTK